MDRVPLSDTRIEYMDRVSRSDTRIEYGLGATFRYQDSILRSGVSRTDTMGIKMMNLEI